MPNILHDSFSGKIAQLLVVLINNVSSQASLSPLPSFLTSPSPPTLSRLARPSQLPAFLLFFFASTSICTAVVSEWVTPWPIPWHWSFMSNIWVEYCDVRGALHWGHVFLSDVSGIALWGCSLNVFVFIFVFDIVFLLVGSCLLITLITCLFLSCLWDRKLIFWNEFWTLTTSSLDLPCSHLTRWRFGNQTFLFGSGEEWREPAR